MARRPVADDTPDPSEPTAPSADDRDRAVMRGGPGDPPAEAPAAPAATPDQPPARTRVKISGRDFDVDPEMATALEDRERDYMRGIQMDRRERDELDRYRRAANPSPTPAVPEFSREIFENPEAAMLRREERLKTELRQEFLTQQATQRTWAKFYQDHPDLVGEEMLVDALLQSNEIGNIRISSESDQRRALEQLADATRREILRISRKAKGTGP